MTDPTACTSVFYDAIDAFQRTHRLPGLQHAQIRGLLAEHLARTVPTVPAVVEPTADRAALRDRIAAALEQADYRPDMRRGDLADAIMPVLPPPADRATILREAADAVAAHPGPIPYRPQLDEDGGFWWDTRDRDAIVALLRRMADETPAAEASVDLPTLAAALDGLDTLIATSSRDWGTYRVDAWLWAVLCGWDCEEDHEHDDLCEDGEAMTEMARQHGWDEATVAKARRYRAAVRAVVETQQDGAAR